MALGSAVRVPISRRMAELNTLDSSLASPILWAAFLTLIVVAPWLLPGYLFGTDWPGTRHIPFPTDLSSYSPLQAALAAMPSPIGGGATGKLLAIGPLFR